jgi:hypothetical protein
MEESNKTFWMLGKGEPACIPYFLLMRLCVRFLEPFGRGVTFVNRLPFILKI